MRTLTIISHTEHYKNPDGSIVGLGSTVTEINHLLEIFDKVVHIAMLHDTAPPLSALPYSSKKISFVALPAVGGASIPDKIAIVFKAPHILNIIRKAVAKTDYFQFRAPTGIGVYVIPYLIWFSSKPGWFKYAGNWKQKQAPLAYSFQRWILRRQSRKVTINGKWEEQPQQCLSFENPCLTEQDLIDGRLTIQQKSLKFPMDFCFVGRLESAKGVDILLETLANLDSDFRKNIGTIHVVGTGSRMDIYKEQVSGLELPIVFHGVLSRDAVHNIYKQCHGIILPSASEGFPKVVAEAMNFGCIPIVSNVSSLSHYIHDGENGFLMDAVDVKSLKACIEHVLNLSSDAYDRLKSSSIEGMLRFSYSYYNKRLLDDVL